MAARTVAVAFVAFSLLLIAASGLVRLPERTAPVTSPPVDPLQCGHWCIERCAMLLGVPATMAEIQKLAPGQENVMSLLDIKHALSTMGLTCRPFRAEIDQLTDAELPCVAHLTGPDHFVVLAGRTASGFRVLDNAHPRRKITFDELRPRWSGNVMHVLRGDEGVGTPEADPADVRRGPRIQFKTLYVDVEVSHDAEEIVYEFPFTNRGTEPLTILNVQPSCSCLHVERPLQPIAAGADGVIKLVYRVTATDNPNFGYQAVVTSSDPRSPNVTLRAEGIVDLRLVPRRFSLGDVVLERPQTITCSFSDRLEGSELVVQGVSTTLTGTTASWQEHLDDESEKWEAQGLRTTRCSSCPPSRRTLDITFVPRKEPDGQFEATIFVEGNFADGVRQVPIHMSGRFVLPVAAFPRTANFEAVQPGSPHQTAVVLTADRARPFTVLRTSAPDGIACDVRESSQSGPRIEIKGDGADLLRASGGNIEILVRFEDSKREYTLQVPLFSWAVRGNPADSSSTSL